MTHIMRYRRSILSVVLCLLLAVTLSACSLAHKFGVSFSTSKSDRSGSMGIHFSQSKDELLKEVDFDGNLEEIELQYSEFELAQGAFVFQLCKDQELVEEYRLLSGESTSGTFQFTTLDQNIKYTLKIIAEDAFDGNIEIKLHSK